MYCQDGKRRGSYEHTVFTFLGYTFRPRRVRTKNGSMFTGFNPGDQQGRPEEDQRAGAVLAAAPSHQSSEADLARRINPVVRGWMNYYGAFYRSALYPLLARINAYLMRWLRKKYKRLRGRRRPRGWAEGGHRNGPVLRPLGLGHLRFPRVW